MRKQHIMTDTTDFTPPAHEHTRRKVAIGVAALFALAAVSGGIAACGGGTTSTLVPGPPVTKTVPAAAPAKAVPRTSSTGSARKGCRDLAAWENGSATTTISRDHGIQAKIEADAHGTGFTTDFAAWVTATANGTDYNATANQVQADCSQWYPDVIGPSVATSAPVKSTPVPVATQPAAAPASSAPASMTSSEQQAVDAAQGYLQLGTGFSAYSLLNQLTSSAGNSFSQSDAQFAINDLSPNWDAQAVDAAKGYLQLGGFSSTSLAQQLTSDDGNGFTAAQADYAVAQVMPGSAAAAPASAAQPSAPSAQSGAPGGPAPQAPVPGTTDPWTVVSQYYANIESQDYTDAWALQSPGYQASNGSLAGWSAGYADAGAETLTENSESGDTVSFSLSAVDTATGNTQQFACSFTVDPTSGLITSGACTQTGES
jgi:hypothetical protein